MMSGFYICDICRCQVPEGKEHWIEVKGKPPLLVCKKCAEAAKNG